MSGENAEREIALDMTKKEAEYWLARLQASLRVIGVTNVKYLALESKNCNLQRSDWKEIRQTYSHKKN